MPTVETAKDPGTLTPQQAWERRVERAKAWAKARARAETDAGDRLRLAVLLTHIETLEWLLERRTEERDGLLEAAKAALRVFKSLADRGRYPRELFDAPAQDDYPNGLGFLLDAIAKVEGE